jgi:hypothetical protein
MEYTGSFSENVAHGYGTLKYKDYIYTGEFDKGI